MSNFQFEGEPNEHFVANRVIGIPAEPKMIRMLTKIGVVKNSKQASIVLLVIASICLISAGFFTFIYLKKNNLKDDPRFQISKPIVEKLSPEIGSKIKIK